MKGSFRTDDPSPLLLPGPPADYLHTSVFDGEHQQLLADRAVMVDVLRDETPLPRPAARDGYYDERHIEYWLSGRLDALKVIGTTGMTGGKIRVLDFGGGSGRVIRHFRQLRPEAELYLSDVNPAHVNLSRALFGGAIRTFYNSATPSLPFPDSYLDYILAFSVFTHIDLADTAWIMELRRVLKPKGCAYLTIFDQSTWNLLPQAAIGPINLADSDLRAYHATNPTLSGRQVYVYNASGDTYQCYVFLSTEYIDRHWAPLFSSYTVAALAHSYQSALLLEA